MKSTMLEITREIEVRTKVISATVMLWLSYASLNSAWDVIDIMQANCASKNTVTTDILALPEPYFFASESSFYSILSKVSPFC